MSESENYTGQCLCGSVKLHVAEINPKFTVCHCGTCRTWTGGPLFAVQCGTDVVLEGDENVTIFDSSPWAERGFCAKCGTNLFYRLKSTQSYYVPLGLFPTLPDLEMDMQYFSDRKPDYYCFSNQTKEMTEAEIMAYFASQT